MNRPTRVRVRCGPPHDECPDPPPITGATVGNLVAEIVDFSMIGSIGRTAGQIFVLNQPAKIRKIARAALRPPMRIACDLSERPFNDV